MPVDGGHRREYTEKSSGVVFGHVLGAVLPMMRHFGEHREAVDGGWTVTDMLACLETLVRETRKPEAELLTLAFQTGVRQLWRERILGCYLRGEITRDEAVEAVGIDWVELAERQHEATMEDLAWALSD